MVVHTASIGHESGLLDPSSTQICDTQSQSTIQEPQISLMTTEDLAENREQFLCILCQNDIPVGDGIILKHCVHQLCKLCLSNSVQNARGPEMKCPYNVEGNRCGRTLLHREIKALVNPQAFENFLKKSLDHAEREIGSFHCLNGDCDGWCAIEGEIQEFECPVCREVNCLRCLAIHRGLTCEQYQEEINKWGCLVCTFLNPQTNQACEMCATQKDSGVRPPEPSTQLQTEPEPEPRQRITQTEVQKNEPDPEPKWDCLACTFSNPEANQACAICGTQKENELRPPLRPTTSIVDPTSLELDYFEQVDLIESRDLFECEICYEQIPPGDGVILKECLHQFCKTCLGRSVEHTEEVEVKCPYRDDHLYCNKPLQAREIKALVSEEVYERYLEKCLSQAENQMENTIHCKTPDCRGWCVIEGDIKQFTCEVCNEINCLSCQVVHKNMTCAQWLEKLKEDSASSVEARQSNEKIQEMIARGEAMICPACGVVIEKYEGCDGFKCKKCFVDICWATKGLRWGPKGPGDTSGGCGCKVNGVLCHPDCQNCH